MDLWMFLVVFLFCFCTQPKIVLAEEKCVSKSLKDWMEDKDSNGKVDTWTHSSSSSDMKRLSTEVQPGGESWFVTPLLNLPNTSYLELEASCSNKLNPCQLEIYGTNQSEASFDKFEFVQNVTFESQHLNITTINKSYTRLLILARVLGTSSAKTSFYIHVIKIRYYFCKETTILNTDLSKVYSSTTNINIAVECGENAVPSDGKSPNITVTCTPKGNWTFGDLECVCDRGFNSTNQNKGCSRCPIHHYKNIIGNQIECQKCPKNKTNNATHTGCQCKNDHYTGVKEDGSCYAVPSEVGSLKIQALTGTTINITWSKPKDNGGFNGSITYTVEVYHCQPTCNVTAETVKLSPGKNNLTTTHVIVSNLALKQEYKFRVISMSNLQDVSNDKWKFVDKKIQFEGPTSAPSEKSVDEKDKNALIVGVAVPCVVIILLIVLIVLILIRRKRRFRRKSKKHGNNNHGFTNVVPLGQRTYVDPSEYDNPEEALRDFTNEISERNLTLERVLGRGEFGEVYKGTLKTGVGGVIKVAVKTLKHDADARSRRDFFLEGSAMGQFNDPNVIHLEGVVTKTIPNMIVIEYMANGSLDNVLKQNDGQFTDLQLVGMARGVASGMKYLAAMNFVHRDLAARNILVNETLLCKVADFGLSRVLETADSSRGEYRALGGKIPVRWTAPEAIKYRKFSTASDVWSYGILLWEIMSFAERPYWDWNNFKLVERIDEGYRLPAPKNCPKAVHELMLLCWESSREKRPEFTAIVGMFDDWIRSPETIRYTNLPKRPVSGGGVHDPAMLVEEWLLDIKMDSYIHIFTQAGLTQLSDLAGLEDSDLQSIGVSLIGHRNKMLRTIRSLPITDETKKTPWNRAPSMKV